MDRLSRVCAGFFYLAFAFFSSVVSAGTPEGSEVLPSEPPGESGPLPSAPETSFMCKGSPLPAGWVIDSAAASVPGYACPGEVYRIRNTVGQSLMFMCVGTPLPNGWVIDNVSADVPGYACPGQIYRIRNTAGQSLMYMCPGTPLPLNWVIDSSSTYYGYVCPGSTYRIRNSVGLSQMYMCNGSVLPDGWVIASSSQEVYGYVCPGLIHRIVNPGAPPPPPPPPLDAPAISEPVRNYNSNTISWVPPAGLDRCILEVKFNDGNWSEVYKGSNRSWTHGITLGQYSYRVRCITPQALTPYSSTVVVTVIKLMVM